MSKLLDDLSDLAGTSMVFESVSKEEEKKNKKAKKEKKKKKKNDIKVEMLSNGEHVDLYDSPLTDKAEEADPTEVLNLLNAEDILYYDEDYDYDVDNIVKTQKASYNDFKQAENPFKKEFAEELTLLYNLLSDYNKFDRVLTKKFDQMDGSKSRGVSKYMNDLIISMLNCKSNKLQTIGKISDLKRTIADLHLKDQRQNKTVEAGTNSPEMVAAQFMNQILSGGRNNFLTNLSNIPFNNTGTDMSEVDDSIDDVFDNLNFRDPEQDKYVQYEHLNPSIIIKRDADTSDWEFVAIDKYGNDIPDYPLPKKSAVGTVTFSDDGLSATDSVGGSYKVLDIVSEL